MLVFALSAMAFDAYGQDKTKDSVVIKHDIGVTIQSWATYAQGPETDSTGNQLGFGIRRVFLRYTGSINNKIEGFVQVQAVSASLLDAFIDYHVTPTFNVRVGRFVGAGTRGGGYDPHASLDIVERAQSAIFQDKYLQNDGWEDYGIQFQKRVGDFTGRLYLHNGEGTINLVPKANDDVDVKGKRIDNEDLAVSGMIIYAPARVKNLEMGGSLGRGNPDIMKYTAYSGYLYYQPGPYRVKAEFIGGKRNDYQFDSAKNMMVDQSGFGYYVFGGYQILPRLELVGRFEYFEPNTDDILGVDDETYYYTVGAVFKQFEGRVNSKITAALVYPDETGANIRNTTAYLAFQLVY